VTSSTGARRARILTRSTRPSPTSAPVTGRRRGRPRRTDAERAEQRARLIDGSKEAVRTAGAEVSIDDLAGAVGVSKPVLYAEFGDKRGIADAIAVALAGELEAQVVAELVDGPIDIEHVVRSVVTALVELIDAEPELYQFVVRSIRSSDRGFLDNALVRVIQERFAALVGLFLPELDLTRLRVLTDGLFGFGFAAVESWQTNHELTKDELISALSTVVQGGIEAAGRLHPRPS